MKMYKFVMPEIIFGNGSIRRVGESCVRLRCAKRLYRHRPRCHQGGLA